MFLCVWYFLDQILARVSLIHLFFYAGFYCNESPEMGFLWFLPLLSGQPPFSGHYTFLYRWAPGVELYLKECCSFSPSLTIYYHFHNFVVIVVVTYRIGSGPSSQTCPHSPCDHLVLNCAMNSMSRESVQGKAKDL